MEGLISVREFLQHVVVVVAKGASVGDELDVILTDSVQFYVPEIGVFSVVAKIDENGFRTELTRSDTIQQGFLVELSELCPSNSRELLLGGRREGLPVDPSFFGNGDSESLLSMEYVTLLVIDL